MRKLNRDHGHGLWVSILHQKAQLGLLRYIRPIWTMKHEREFGRRARVLRALVLTHDRYVKDVTTP